MRKPLLLFLCLFGIALSQAQIFNYEMLQYTVTDATNRYVSVNKIGTTCPTGRLWIPVTVDFNGITYAVKSIEDNAFSGCSDITEVSMNSGLFHIGHSAFRNCTSLASFRISNLVTSIGNYAFENCSSLIRFGIPNDVTIIGVGTFNNCTSLVGIGIPEGITNIGDQAFNNCSSLTNIIIPSTVTSIGIGAFRNCSNLNNIVIPNNVITIGVESFSNCFELKSVDIGKGVTNLGDSAFEKCSALSSVTVHWDTPLSINANVFEDVVIENIPLTIPSDSETAYQAASVWQNFGSYLKYFNDGVLEYTVTDIPNSYVSVKKYDDTCPTGNLTIPGTVNNNGTTYTITSIEERAFEVCVNLTGVSLPDRLTNIGVGSFRGCTSLESVFIPNGVTRLEHGTFADCIALTNVSLPESLAEIGQSVFLRCTSLTEVILPESLIRIGRAAFQSCTSMTSITIPDSVTSIEEYAFSMLTGLTNFTIPNGIASIEEYTFWESSGLTNVIIPEGVSSIGFGAFMKCTSLTSVSIPASVTSIGERAFENNTSLTSVITHWSNPIAINANVFQNVAIENIPLTIPSGSLAAYQAAAVWKDFGSFVLGITDFVMETIRLYPNPTSSFLKIDLNGTSELKKATIYNNLGQLISEEKETQISVSNYSKGLYFAEIETTQGKVTKRFLVD
ncbi:leucine-rich repeat domain-containing protein [Gelidibacter gilvus]|uniref:T9SS type A sorting domain-containing protein n=1 Tax=Gelidibacter gilvus TaxID=59602 RepID=A0A4Q0XKT7_9FLAO|nr:leucine-rich repeat domain-containing protein [Gelidibacter gilvus]RXJ52415.1 T9SS type A sorting domain-containing protein [Gelidibacter gilvus]